MAAGVGLRGEYSAAALRGLARASDDAGQVRRLRALAVILDGGSRRAAAEAGGVGRQTVRDWVLRFNARGSDGLIDGKAPGKVPLLDDAQRRALAAMVEAGPIAASHGVVRWRLVDLAAWVWDEFKLSVSRQTLGRELRALGYRKLSARPRHVAQATEAIPDFKSFPDAPAQIRARLPGGTPVELWWQDEARLGQKTGITRRWAWATAPGHPPPGISGPPRRTSSARSVRPKARRRRSSCRDAISKPWRCTSPNRLPRRAGRARRAPARPRRVARVRHARCAHEHHPPAASAQMPRTQPCRERLAVPARQLAVEPHLSILRRHRRPRLPRLEPPRRSAVAHHVARTAPMGAWVTFNGLWYKAAAWFV